MARKGSEKNPVSSKNNPLSGENQAVRPVKPVVTPDDTEPETPAPSGGKSPDSLGAIGKAKDFISDAGNTAGNAVTKGVQGLKNSWFGIKPAVSAVSSGVTKVAEFLHVPKGVTAAVMALVLLGGGAAGGIAIVNNQRMELLYRQEDYYDPCGDMLDEVKNTGMNLAQAEGDKDTLAAQLWQLGKELGFTDEQCAGMLGNMEQESNIDPTSVEGIFDEPYQIGPKKAVLFGDSGATLPDSDMDAYLDIMQARYAASSPPISINRSAYYYDGVHVCIGIGLIGWTGPTGYNLIQFAEAQGKQWYDLDVQAATLLKLDSSRLTGFQNQADCANDVNLATDAWLGYMERGVGRPEHSGFQVEQRRANAQGWYTKFAGSEFPEYKSWAQDVIAMAEISVEGSAKQHKKEVEDECLPAEGPAADNSTIAAAAVAYAWETEDMGHNDGTDLYIDVHKAMWGGDIYYRSCDRSVMTAVKWAGADDLNNIVAGGCGNLMQYFDSHPDLWQNLGTVESNMGDLQPGDIFIHSGHVVMYVGNEAVQAKYPGSTAEMVSGSIGSAGAGHPSESHDARSPGCGPLSSYYTGGDSRGSYTVYRYLGSYTGEMKSYTSSANGEGGSGYCDGTPCA